MISDVIKSAITRALKDILKEGLNENVPIPLEHPTEISHGDYSTNIAFQILRGIAEKINKSVEGGDIHVGDNLLWKRFGLENPTSPRQVAERLVLELQKNLPAEVEKIEVAGPGFINFFLSERFLRESVKDASREGFGKGKRLHGEKVLIEYTDPNPFKEFHIGHLMSNAIGESISRLTEFEGAEVKRACYQGDVGLHVAKAIWGMQKANISFPHDHIALARKAQYLGMAYKMGAQAYENEHKADIEALNKKIYDRSDAEVNRLYDWGRQASLDYFDVIYKRLGTKFNYFFFESEMAGPGVEIVKKFLGKVFEESEGAIVFRGEKFNPKLHTRVYVTSQGLPTYEAKELALHIAKAKKYDASHSVVVTANEQDGVYSVGLEAFRQIDKEHASRITHLSHGVLRLPSGKMSSRTGDVLTAEWLLEEVGKLVEEKIKDRGYDKKLSEEIKETVSVAAVKYSILRQSIGGDIIFDFDKSLSFEGDSGPYLLYSLTRAKSVLLKAHEEKIKADVSLAGKPMLLSQLLYRFPEIVERAAKEYAPHYLVTYLIELSSAFNGFYATERIADKDDANAPYRVALTKAFAHILENGLWLLGIPTLEKM